MNIIRHEHNYCSRQTQLDVVIDEEVAAKVASIFERYRAAGGNVDHVEYITDRTEAVKVIGCVVYGARI